MQPRPVIIYESISCLSLKCKRVQADVIESNVECGIKCGMGMSYA